MGCRLNKISGPEWQVAGEFSRAADFCIRFDYFGLNGSGDDLGNDGGLALRLVEACAQGLVGHAFTRHPFQAAVLVASSGAVDAVHLLERAGRKQDDREALEPGAKIRSVKLVGFDGQNDLVHATAFLLANAHPAHEVGEAFVKCFKRAVQLGLEIRANIPGERLEVCKGSRTFLWWTAVILGFCCYIIPGVLVLAFWKPGRTCTLIFDQNDDGTSITAQVSGEGEGGIGFFNEISGLLME